MHRYGSRIVLLIALPMVVAACSRAGDTSDMVARDRSADEAAIRALIVANEAATNRRDSAGVAATYTSEGDVWIVGRSRLSGLDEIRRNEEEFYGTPGFREWHTKIDAIRFVSRDAALVESTDLTILDTGTIEARSTWIVGRDKGEWRIAAVRVMSIGE